MVMLILTASEVSLRNVFKGTYVSVEPYFRGHMGCICNFNWLIVGA